jgi:hypothetical protein
MMQGMPMQGMPAMNQNGQQGMMPGNMPQGQPGPGGYPQQPGMMMNQQNMQGMEGMQGMQQQQQFMYMQMNPQQMQQMQLLQMQQGGGQQMMMPMHMQAMPPMGQNSPQQDGSQAQMGGYGHYPMNMGGMGQGMQMVGQGNPSGQ